MVFDDEAVKVMVVVTVYEDDKAAATSGEEWVSQEATAAETVFFVEEVTVVETAVEVTVVTVEVTAPGCVRWCSCVRQCYAGKSDHAQQKRETRDEGQQPSPEKCG